MKTVTYPQDSASVFVNSLDHLVSFDTLIHRQYETIKKRITELELEIGPYRGSNDGWSLEAFERELTKLKARRSTLSRLLGVGAF